MSVQIVRPAGAGHETAWVLAACALVLALAGAAVGVRTSAPPAAVLQAHQIDARRDLTPAEQGVYADLRTAADELLAYDAPPPVAELAGLGIAPFAADASAARRGAHAWRQAGEGARIVYVGTSAQPAVAGSFLLALEHHPGHRHDHGQAAEPEVWLHRGAAPAVPARLDAEALAGAGWRRVVARFDAGVTRERRIPSAPLDVSR